ncbi:MAG: hypothetical protein AAGF04_05875 [Chlamydiota bacterium]
MSYILLFLGTFFSSFFFLGALVFAQPIVDTLVVAEQQIYLPDYPNAYNPSILRIPGGFLLSFRYTPNCKTKPYISYIGLVELDQAFHPISEPQLVHVRRRTDRIPSQAEDARLFLFRDKIYLIYNDNRDVKNPGVKQRRDIFITELYKNGSTYFTKRAIKLISEDDYSQQNWQKNWVPIIWNEELLISYTLDPHKVLKVDLITGKCVTYTSTAPEILWNYGSLRGSSTPCVLEDEYFGFFHSSRPLTSDASSGAILHHYFAGAYTFLKDPPFSLTRVSKYPIAGPGFYTHNTEKLVIFPGGFVIEGDFVYLVYGKDDREMWVATIPLVTLLESLVPVKLAEAPTRNENSLFQDESSSLLEEETYSTSKLPNERSLSPNSHSPSF